MLEDRLRAHPLVSQCMVVGDGRPYVACLVTLDEEALEPWKGRHGKPASASLAELASDPELIAEIQTAVDDANKAVSRAESIRRFRILPVDFTEQDGHLTPVAQGPPGRGGQGLRRGHRRPLRVTGLRADRPAA